MKAAFGFEGRKLAGFELQVESPDVGEAIKVIGADDGRGRGIGRSRWRGEGDLVEGAEYYCGCEAPGAMAVEPGMSFGAGTSANNWRIHWINPPQAAAQILVVIREGV